MDMNYMIRELRTSTGMTQKDFAHLYGIPLSTLRKWEQGEASPAPYVLTLIARTLPSSNETLKQIKGDAGAVFYYDKWKKTVVDARGNAIQIEEELEGVKEENLRIYLQELYADFYEIQEKFNRDCRFDKEDDIIWT